jgi:arsenate reductase
MDRRRVIFICSHNSARSQMAEAMLREWGGDGFEAFSAGTKATAVRPEAIQVMREIGMDISRQQSKSLDQFVHQPFSWVITVCDSARQDCPIFPGAEDSAHWAVDDPAEVTGSEEERLRAFRAARDDLRNRIHMFLLAASRDDLPRPSEKMLGTRDA